VLQALVLCRSFFKIYFPYFFEQDYSRIFDYFSVRR
jgi:hypothetical protein